MSGQDELAERFEAQRGRLRAVAYRMLGSLGEAEDAVQETWLRLARTDADEVENLPGWLRTVISRICLDMLRSRASRREDPEPVSDEVGADGGASGPEEEALLADSVGLALLVVLDRLSPAERVAFVLHDSFGVPFEQIGPVVGRSTVTTKKLASRARHKVRGTSAPPAELDGHRRVVEAFLAAARGGDLGGLLAVLAPDVVRRADAAALPPGGAPELRGARAVAEQTVLLRGRARFSEVALVDGAVGAVVAPRGRLRLVLKMTVEDGRITSYEAIADPVRLRGLALAVLDTGVTGR
ncbi:sigma-70 family RNA polymerase sigma factor [Streptomyces sp. NPDC003753]|uniref:sigma-70 family RNA polymerase sigma factor n=1 Tax=unclassified Streptomyces TaxID=2593676 RepID=UPI001907823C|nr:sigma-70 family RNA polymerase sigma factor [Streptomyces sp. Y2F8-2]GHK05254.1 DNA-directed RNA polymerase sigma-70 factor [Streptomyces sp. Y2F8-2]